MSEPTGGGYVTHDDLVAALSKVGTEFDTLAGQQHELVTIVTGLAEDLTSLSAKTAAAGDVKDGGRGRWLWRTLPPGPVRTALWWQVRDFVSWYNTRYGYSSDRTAIWACWPQHPVVVEELTALMVAHEAAYAGDDATDAIIAWHDRWLWPAIERVHTRHGGFAGCTATSHEIRHTVDVDDVDHQMFAAAIASDADRARDRLAALNARTRTDRDLPAPAACLQGDGADIPAADEPAPESW